MISKAASQDLKEQLDGHTVDDDSHASGQEPHLAPARDGGSRFACRLGRLIQFHCVVRKHRRCIIFNRTVYFIEEGFLQRVNRMGKQMTSMLRRSFLWKTLG